MNQRERLAICSNCINRQLDFKAGYLCKLTGKPADFRESCKYYRLDETVINTDKVPKFEWPGEQFRAPAPVPVAAEKKKISAEKTTTTAKKPTVAKKSTPETRRTAQTKQSVEKKKLPAAVRKKLRKYQSFILALIGGLLFTAAFSVCWVFAAETTGYEGAYLAIGLGLLVGIAVRFFGAGINRIFGVLAALLTLAGSLTGHYLSQTEFLKEATLAGIITLPDYLNLELMIAAIRDNFVPTDLLFYGLAALLSYLLAIRRISKKKMARLEQDDYKGAPALHWLRLPLILVCILLPAYYGYTLTGEDAGGFKTLYYDSGVKMSQGEIQKGMEAGLWITWHENGNMKSMGYYKGGEKDSLWQWYDESGILSGSGTYRDGVENGPWMNYYPDGKISDSGAYLNGLKEGPWNYYSENGSLKYSINYKAGEMVEKE